MSRPAGVPTLTDGVVTLRGHRAEDAQRCWEQCQDPQSQAWTTVPVPYSMAMAQEFVTEAMPAGWAGDTEWAFAIEVAGAYGGTCSLRNQGDHVAEIAYGSHPAIRGTGAVGRALRLLVDWGFRDQALETILWRANVGNWPSRKAAWRLGFAVEGTVRRWLPQRGELHDAWLGTLLREDPREPRTTWLGCPELTGEGLRLRPLRAGDAERIVEACGDPRTQHWLGQLPSPYTRRDALAYVESRTEMLATGAGATWAIADPDDDRLLGAIGWFNWRPGVECEIGYWTHPDARGRGLMTRAVTRVTDHVVDTLDLKRVTVFAAVDNTASRHVAGASGFRQYAVERYGAQVRDGWSDLVLYDVTIGEWRSARAESTSTANPAIDRTAPTSSGER